MAASDSPRRRASERRHVARGAVERGMEVFDRLVMLTGPCRRVYTVVQPLPRPALIVGRRSLGRHLRPARFHDLAQQDLEGFWAVIAFWISSWTVAPVMVPIFQAT